MFFTIPLFSQVSVTFLLSPTIQNAQIVYISNFDFIQQGSAQFLFQVTMENFSGQEQFGWLEFLIVKDGYEIVIAKSNFFHLPSNPPIITFNNIQLMTGFPLPPYFDDEIRFDETTITSPDEFRNETLQGGRLPGGRYIFNIKFVVASSGEEFPAPPKEIIVISSPYVLPIAPGTEDLSAPEIIYTPFPVFQFNTNLSDPLALAGDPFIVQVYKKQDYHLSADEVLSTWPHLEYRTGTTLFQYPQGEGEQPLEPGSYLWRVQMVLMTTNGTEIVNSPLFAFKYTDPTNASEDIVARASADEVLRLLRYLIGNRADVYAEMLNAYKLTTMRINGETVDLTNLYNKIIQYEGKVFKVSEIDLLSTQN